MKKILIKALILTSMFLSLTACGGTDDAEDNNGSNEQQTTSVEQELPIGSDVTIYLVLGEIGKYKGNKGENYPDLFIENAVKLETKVGDALPGDNDVTSTSGAKFKGWVKYDGNGALTKYEKAPGYMNTILYANFVA